MTDDPECPGPDCPLCNGSACDHCGAGAWRHPLVDGVRCDHDGMERHEPPPRPWRGPEEADLQPDGTSLRRPVPPERWPYGPPSHHEDCCRLHTGALFCDCLASAADDIDWGEASHTASISAVDDVRRGSL